MFEFLRRPWESFRGAGDHALTVPPMDGAFRPNMALENAIIAAETHDPDNLVAAGSAIYFSGANQLFRLLENGVIDEIQIAGGHITALAGRSDGLLAIAQRGQGITFVAAESALSVPAAIPPSPGDVTAMTFAETGELVVANGSDKYDSSQWRHDFLEGNNSGSIWLFDLSSSKGQAIASGLAYPYGVVSNGAGGFVVSEAWESRLVAIDGKKKPLVLLENLPAYPSRIIPASQGGYWLSFFAPRNQIVELVLREPEYRQRMMAEVAPDNWISPSLVPQNKPTSPMQEGGTRHGGQIKPWAPSFSYGLVARLNSRFQPEFSFHSRANGTRHGVTSICERENALLVASRGGNVIVELDQQGGEV